jgi:hypothetical protein
LAVNWNSLWNKPLPSPFPDRRLAPEAVRGKGFSTEPENRSA